MKHIRLFTLTALLLAPLATLHAAGPNPPEGFRALFNGNDLAGWHGLNPHTGAKFTGEKKDANLRQQREDFPNHWRVENGELVNAGTGPYATTDGEFGDIELHLEYKTVAKADSGIYLRGTPQVQIWAKPEGSGALWNNKTHPNRPLKIVDRPPGQWNRFRILMTGEQVTILLNDELIVQNVTLENYWERDKSVYPTGPIELQAHTTRVYFKNIYVRAIPHR